MKKDIDDDTQSYLSDQPRREWVGLTDDDVERIVSEARVGEHGIGYTIARAIEAKLKELNT